MYMPYRMLRVYVYAVSYALRLCICRIGCFVFLYMLYRMLRVLMLCFFITISMPCLLPDILGISVFAVSAFGFYYRVFVPDGDGK